jgi:hypothetical protein
MTPRRHVIGLPALLLAAALPRRGAGHAAGSDLPCMLRAVPLPPRLPPGVLPLAAFGRIDPAGAAPVALGLARLPLDTAAVEHWPALLGFGFEEVKAVLAAPIAVAGNPAGALRLLAGGAALRDAERIGAALSARGFMRAADGIWSNGGAEDSIDLARRDRTDPFGAGRGLAQRIAVTEAGVLVASHAGVVRAALAALGGRGPSLAGAPGLPALLAGLAGMEVSQLLILPPLAAAGDPAQLLRGARPDGAMQPPATGPAMPPWAIAGLAAGAPGQRLVLVAPDAEALRPALQARIPEAELRVLPSAVVGFGALVAELRPPPDLPLARTPFHRWWTDIQRRQPVPFTIGTTP